MTQPTDFPLGDEDLHCNASARSFSVASTGSSVPSPYTPTSGRSTPALSLGPLMMDQVAMGCGVLNMSVTPSHTVYGSSMSPTGAEPPQYLDMAYHQYAQMVTPPSEDIPQPQFPTDGYNQYDQMTTWACPMDSQPLFGERGLSQGNPFMGDGVFPTQYLSVHERSAALHQVQGRPRITRRPRMPMVMVQRHTAEHGNISAMVFESGKFKCQHAECRDRNPFKRQEHLKRHQMTVHDGADMHKCRFCGICFNRHDNYRSHLKLHTKKGKGRTTFYEEAVLAYEAEQAKTRPRRQGKNKAARSTERRRQPKIERGLI